MSGNPNGQCEQNGIPEEDEQVIRDMFKAYCAKNYKADFKSFREGIIVAVGLMAQPQAAEVANAS